MVRLFFDTQRSGLEAVFGPRPGIYLGEVRVPAGATRADARLVGLPHAPSRGV